MTKEERTTAIRAGRAGYGSHSPGLWPLWERVHRFVRQQAHRYYTLHAGTCVHAGAEQDDLVQCGFPALQDAARAVPAIAEALCGGNPHGIRLEGNRLGRVEQHGGLFGGAGRRRKPTSSCGGFASSGSGTWTTCVPCCISRGKSWKPE